MPTKYSVTFRRNDRLGTEEYDGGYSIEDARREAAFFCANLPADISVKICKINPRSQWCALEVVEVVR